MKKCYCYFKINSTVNIDFHEKITTTIYLVYETTPKLSQRGKSPFIINHCYPLKNIYSARKFHMLSRTKIVDLWN